MARNSNNPYAKRRQKVKKPQEQKSPFKKELVKKRNNRIVYAVVIIIIVVMVGTLILPYMTGSSTTNYSLPSDVLKADEATTEDSYSVQNISVGETYNRVDTEYYVLFGSQEDTAELAQKIARDAYYLVDSSQEINSSLTKDVDKGKDLPNKPADIKIKKDVALIHIKEGKAIKFIDNKTDVTKFIDKLE
ncbi:hypothetical protein LJB88_02745 [Erysipelotrichaceae bacterium OttesenSCG-928-M19]|nr:hypothetical protein [Erysipelotrichaceae bacterium OttesenSCG-928-M19]